MAQTIKLKRNVTNENAPPANSLEVGEVAVNSVTGKLYTKNTSDAVVEISGSGGGGGGTAASVHGGSGGNGARGEVRIWSW